MLRHIDPKILRNAAVLGLVLATLGTGLCRAEEAQTAASAAAAAGQAGEAQVMYLGPVEVKGQQQIMRVLMAIKIALDQPLSTDKAHENDVICRMTSPTGARTRTYLTCGTNRQLTHMRYMAQEHLFEDESHFGQSSVKMNVEPTELLEQITAQNPNHMLQMPVDKAKLLALLKRIPGPDASSAPMAGTVSDVPDSSDAGQPGTPPG